MSTPPPLRAALLVDPPQSEWIKLRTPLTAGELRFLSILLAILPEGWETYVQPHLNGLRPDVVVLHPQVGIAVYEVKDWRLDAMAYRYDAGPGQSPLLTANDGRRTFSIASTDPVLKVDLYKREIFELYVPSFTGRNHFGLITAGVVLPFATRHQAAELFGPARRIRGHEAYPDLYPLVTLEDLDAADINKILPRASRATRGTMVPGAAEEIRHWLIEPEVSSEQRTRPILDRQQERLRTTRTGSGYRRIKGPAGCGKSIVLAARAAELAKSGMHVLVATFNITLRQYLRDYATRFDIGAAHSNVDYMHFHGWCKRVCRLAGREDDYDALWKTRDAGLPELETQDDVLDEALPRLVSEILGEPDVPDSIRYDAILVDEGQDFRLAWWNVLRQALRPGGEAVLIADRTQDLYGTAKVWTEDVMSQSGFVGGPWVNLQGSYRLPDQLLPITREFAERFLPEALRELPERPERQLALTDCDLRWVQIGTPDRVRAAVISEFNRLMSNSDARPATADITILVQSASRGTEIVGALEARGINVLHTFDADRRRERKRKLHFYKGHAGPKVTTIKSFKGWETPALIVVLDHAADEAARAEAYVGITRLRRSDLTSSLCVVCSAPELAGFGSGWPAYQRLA